MENLIQNLRDSLLAYGPSVLGALTILVVGWLISRGIASGSRRAMSRGQVDPTLIGFLGSVVYVGAMTLVVISALARLGVNTTSFAAVLAAVGLAIGLALQGSLGNLASGVMLILFRPFKTGDYVEVAGIAGVIEEIQIFATRLRTPDNKEVIVPNGAITGGSITNYSSKQMRRVDLVFGIGYGDDIKLAKSIIQKVVDSQKLILKDPAPVIAVLELGDSSVNLAVRPWVRTPEYWNVHFDLTERIKLEFDAAGISIPFPQRDVHVHQAA